MPDPLDPSRYWFAVWQFTNQANGLLVTEAQIYYDEELTATKVWTGVHSVDGLLLARTWFLRHSGRVDPPHMVAQHGDSASDDIQLELPF